MEMLSGSVFGSHYFFTAVAVYLILPSASVYLLLIAVFVVVFVIFVIFVLLLLLLRI